MFYKLLFIMQSNEIQFTNIYYVMNIFQSHIYIRICILCYIV